MNTALNTPMRRGRREIHTGDMEVGQRPDLLIPETGPVVREPETIVAADGPIDSDYARALAFMEEPVTIELARLSEKFAPTLIDVYVNGVCEWVPVGQPYTLKRKFVEVIARCKPDDIETVTGSIHDDNPENRIARYTRAKYPFAVIHDPSGAQGHAWLTKVMREG